MEINDEADIPTTWKAPKRRIYSRNKFILRWWTPEHDVLLVDTIERLQWHWY